MKTEFIGRVGRSGDFIMLSEMPFSLKQEALRRLHAGDFKAAKALHDQWMASHAPRSFDPTQPTDIYTLLGDG